jgi:cold shock CspA family protein
MNVVLRSDLKGLQKMNVVGEETVEVKYYNGEKGYGFAKTETKGDAFFHIKNVRNKLPSPEIGNKFVASLEKTEEGKLRVQSVIEVISQ